MGDISHSYGLDIDLSAGGDLLYVPDETQQHVVKRLLTSGGADIWYLSYGAGLGQFVGQPADVAAITNVIRSQIFQEPGVAQMPEPFVTISQQNTSIEVTISYTEVTSGQTQAVSFSLG